MSKKIAVIFGTRPDAIKMAPLVLESKNFPELDVVPISSGQHDEMLKQVLDIFELSPAWDAKVMLPGQSLDQLTAKIVVGIGKILDEVHPDIVLVHGDTTTALGSALAAFYRNIPVGHVEAGLRTETLTNPFPEEMNRRCIDRISSYLFAPTKRAVDNLTKEGVAQPSIILTGNTIVDSIAWARQKSVLPTGLALDSSQKLVLLTTHRRENIGDGMEHIFRAIKEIVRQHAEVRIVFPIHLNTKVREIAQAELSEIPNISIIEPVSYTEMLGLLENCYLVLTDSGGIQEEAPAFGRPVVVLRETTERPEIIDSGNGLLVGTDQEKIVSTVSSLLTDVAMYKQMAEAANPYGEPGVARTILSYLSSKS